MAPYVYSQSTVKIYPKKSFLCKLVISSQKRSDDEYGLILPVIQKWPDVKSCGYFGLKRGYLTGSRWLNLLIHRHITKVLSYRTNLK